MDRAAIEKLCRIVPSERVLLLPHCLRQSNTCKAKYNEQGLQCLGCNPECSVNRLRSAAMEYGYKGICVAPGGRLAVKYITEMRPAAIIAVACDKELEEGVKAIQGLAKDDDVPLIVIVPLLKDGCVDTVVDTDEALEVIGAGCVPVAVGK
jgi:hypothetical protein